MRKLAYFLLFACTSATAQETAYLDLVTLQIQGRQREPTSASGAASGVGGGDAAAFRRPSGPLKLKISEPEGLQFRIGETFVYEVRVENTSDRAVKIPWTPSPKRIEPPKQGPYEYQMVSLTPQLVNPMGAVIALEGVLIYGSNAPSTTLELAPGHWVRIRAKSKLNFQRPGDATAFFSKGQNSTRLRAAWSAERVSVTERDGQYHETFSPVEMETQSVNAIPVHILASASSQ